MSQLGDLQIEISSVPAVKKPLESVGTTPSLSSSSPTKDEKKQERLETKERKGLPFVTHPLGIPVVQLSTVLKIGEVPSYHRDLNHLHKTFRGRDLLGREHAVKKIDELSTIEDTMEDIVNEVFFTNVARLIATLAGCYGQFPECCAAIDDKGNYFGADKLGLMSSWVKGCKSLSEIKSDKSFRRRFCEEEIGDAATNQIIDAVIVDVDAGIHNKLVAPPSAVKTKRLAFASSYRRGEGKSEPPPPQWAVVGIDRGMAGNPEAYNYEESRDLRNWRLSVKDVNALPRLALAQEPYPDGFKPKNGGYNQISKRKVKHNKRYWDRNSATVPAIRIQVNTAILATSLVSRELLTLLGDRYLGKHPDKARCIRFQADLTKHIAQVALQATPPTTGADLNLYPEAGTFEHYLRQIAADEVLRKNIITLCSDNLKTFTCFGEPLVEDVEAQEILERSLMLVLARLNPSLSPTSGVTVSTTATTDEVKVAEQTPPLESKRVPQGMGVSPSSGSGCDCDENVFKDCCPTCPDSCPNGIKSCWDFSIYLLGCICCLPCIQTSGCCQKNSVDEALPDQKREEETTAVDERSDGKTMQYRV